MCDSKCHDLGCLWCEDAVVSRCCFLSGAFISPWSGVLEFLQFPALRVHSSSNSVPGWISLFTVFRDSVFPSLSHSQWGGTLWAGSSAMFTMFRSFCTLLPQWCLLSSLLWWVYWGEERWHGLRLFKNFDLLQPAHMMHLWQSWKRHSLTKCLKGEQEPAVPSA